MSENIGTAGGASALWGVIDTNARNGDRIHEVAPGVPYALRYDRPTPMTMLHAMVFLRDPSFTVIDDLGQVQSGLPQAERGDSAYKRPVMEPGETIAKYEELTTTALLSRAVIRPGGQGVNPRSRADLVAFLTAAPEKADAKPGESGRSRTGESSDPDAISQQGLDAMLGDKPDPLAMG